MERILSSEEKIRRAEEIYNRRRQGGTKTTATVSVQEGKSYGLFKKMILQIAICLLIYFIFYLIQNSNYIFSQDVLNKTKEILSYDIDIPVMYQQTMNFFSEQMQGLVPKEEDSNTTTNTMTNEVNQIQINEIEENAIGGADLQNVVMEDTLAAHSEEENKEVPQTDDEYIKKTFSFIRPVEGVVSSEFGQRDVENPIVSKNHTGIDLAANTGTVIHAAMEGTVSISSTVGDYGHHIKIENQDVSTLYAHCSKLYVKQGEVVKQGQEIAEVGTTGKSTGPHLHFEIMRGSTYINPRNVMEF